MMSRPVAIRLLRCRRMAEQTARTVVQGSIKGFVYLLPDVCTDTPENNNLLAAVTSTDLPSFSKIELDETLRGLGRMCLDYKFHGENHMKTLDMTKTPTFESVFLPLDEELAPLVYAGGIANIFLLTSDVRKSGYLNDFMKTFESFCDAKVNGARYHKMYRLAQEMSFNEKDLTHYQRSVAGSYALSCYLNGQDLTKKEREVYNVHAHRLNVYRKQFRSQIAVAYPNFEHEIEDPLHMVDAPDYVKYFLLQRELGETDYQKGPWIVHLNPLSYWYFIRYCSNRERRFNSWYAWNTRAGWHHQQTNNSRTIEEIRFYRQQMSHVFRKDNYSNLRLIETMAGSVDNVQTFLDSLKDRMQPEFETRYKQMSEFAAKEDYVKDGLRPWDLYYYSRKYAETTNDVKPLEICQYFPFVHVFLQLVQMAEAWFDIEFEDVTKQVERWHPSVKVFAINDKTTGHIRGHVYVDPYVREGKVGAWQNVVIRSRVESCGYTPIIAIMGNAMVPTPENPSLLHYTEVIELLRLFGDSMKNILSDFPYEHAFFADWRETDTRHTIESFFELLFYQPTILQYLTKHHESGDQLPIQKAESVCKAAAQAQLWESYRNVFISDFDVTINSVPDVEDAAKYFWLKMYREMYKTYFPFPLEQDEWHFTNFTPIFSGTYSVIYYKRLWSEMIAMDLIESFKEAGGFDNRAKTIEVARRLKDTILRHYGGQNMSEMFRQFRGRDPSVEPICQFYAPKETKNVIDSDRTERLVDDDKVDNIVT